MNSKESDHEYPVLLDTTHAEERAKEIRLFGPNSPEQGIAIQVATLATSAQSRPLRSSELPCNRHIHSDALLRLAVALLTLLASLTLSLPGLDLLACRWQAPE